MPGILKNTVQSEEQNVKETYIVKQTAARMEIAAAGWKVVFDKVTGQLLEYRVRGKRLITAGPTMNLWRAPIDNDMYKVRDWKEKYFLHRQQEKLEEFLTENEGEDILVRICTHFSTLSMAFGFKVCYTWRIRKNGELVLSLDMKGFRYSGFVPEFIPRIGIELRLPKEMKNIT